MTYFEEEDTRHVVDLPDLVIAVTGELVQTLLQKLEEFSWRMRLLETPQQPHLPPEIIEICYEVSNMSILYAQAHGSSNK